MYIILWPVTAANLLISGTNKDSGLSLQPGENSVQCRSNQPFCRHIKMRHFKRRGRGVTGGRGGVMAGRENMSVTIMRRLPCCVMHMLSGANAVLGDVIGFTPCSRWRRL